MATLTGSTIASTYDQLVKRADTYVQTGTNIELMNDSAVIQPTGLYLESGAVTDYVGIGQPAPTSPLHIYENSSNTGAAILLEQDGAGDATLAFTLTGAKSWAIGADNGSTDNFVISESNVLQTNPRVTIIPDGKVGIGESAPDTLLHLKATSSNEPILTIEGDHELATGPSIHFYQDSQTPADDDVFGNIEFKGNTDDGAGGKTSDKVTFASIEVSGTDTGNSSKDGQIKFNTMVANSATDVMTMKEGNVGIGTIAPNANLEIDQGAEDTPILKFVSSDVTIAMTDITEQADVYGLFKKYIAANGGLEIAGATSASRAVSIVATAATEDTDAPDATSDSCFVINTTKTNGGTGTTGHGAGGLIFQIENNGGAKFIIDAEGDVFSDAASAYNSASWDTHEDAQLVRTFELSRGEKAKGLIESKFDQYITYNHETLAEARLVGREADGTPNHFVNVTGMQRLHNGAIWQQYTEMQKMKEMMYETMVELIGKEKADEKLEAHDISLLENKDLLN